jgi:catechol-2,3-dioxygenase
MATGTFPTPEMQLTHLLVVRDLEVARSFYRDVLGATVYRDYGGRARPTLSRPLE